MHDILRGKLFISTQFPVAESVFCFNFKFWLNFRFFKIRGFDLIIFFRRNLRKTLKLVHKLAWTVGCQHPKFQNFEQAFLASTTSLAKHYQNREKVRKTPILPIVQTGQTQDLARFARSRLAVLFWWLIFFIHVRFGLFKHNCFAHFWPFLGVYICPRLVHIQ